MATLFFLSFFLDGKCALKFRNTILDYPQLLIFFNIQIRVFGSSLKFNKICAFGVSLSDSSFQSQFSGQKHQLFFLQYLEMLNNYDSKTWFFLEFYGSLKNKTRNNPLLYLLLHFKDIVNS